MAKRSKFGTAKRASLKKFRGLLRDLPKLTLRQFDRRVESPCGFCDEYNDGRLCFGSKGCPAHNAPCGSEEFRSLVDRTEFRYWRKPAAEFCEWVIREVKKLKDPEAIK